jgi:hypothetical protein
LLVCRMRKPQPIGCLEKNAMDLRKVYGGTAIGQDSRCDSCVFARVIRGYSESECITLCDRLYEAIRIPFKVRECSDYIDKRLPRIEHFEDIAWILRSKSAGHRAGFNPVAVANAEDDASEDPVETTGKLRRKFRLAPRSVNNSRFVL